MNVKDCSIVRFDDGELVGILKNKDESNLTVIISENGQIGGVYTETLIADRTWKVLSEHDDVPELIYEMAKLVPDY